MVRKYRKKPIVIEAIQWVGDNMIEIDNFFGSKENTYHKANKLIVKILEGDMTADKYDWIIKGVKDEFYPCKPDIFKATYELVD